MIQLLRKYITGLHTAEKQDVGIIVHSTEYVHIDVSFKLTHDVMLFQMFEARLLLRSSYVYSL